MLAKPLAINQTGIEAVLWFADNPARLEEDIRDLESGQKYVPGISVPGVEGLEEPFNVPILGDDEAVSLSIAWPRTGIIRPLVVKQVALTWLIPAEPLTRGPAMNESSMEDQLDADLEDDSADVAFEHYLDVYGGFIQVRTDKQEILVDDSEVVEVTTGSAELFVIESLNEFDAIKEALSRYRATAADIVMAARGLRLALNLPIER